MIYSTTILTHLLPYERSKKCQKKLKNMTKLAWTLLSEICAKLIEYLKEILLSKEFVNRHKKSEKDFTRNRILPFQTLFLYFMVLHNNAYF